MNSNKILIRTSTEDQNPENQLRDCQTINSYGDADIIKEQNSAWKDILRPKLNKLKEDIASGNVRHLIVWDLDRLFRNRNKLMAFFKFCKYYDCQIHSFRQRWLEELNKMPSPFDEIMHNLMLQFVGWMAEEESRLKSDRVKIAHKNSNKKWGRKPLNKNIEKKVLELHNQGKSIREIASSVIYWDVSRNRHNISKSAVHKIIKLNKDINS
jgi:DNA invertase Pin-like site-specific DNA recombinase